MMELIKEYKDKVTECEDRLVECFQERQDIQDGEFNQNSCNRDKYRNLGSEIVELHIKISVYKEVYNRLVAYFTTNA